MRRFVNAMIALLVWVPSAWAFPLTFSTDPSGNLIVTSSSSGTFPMAGYRRSFSTPQELAQFCADNLGATPVYDGSGSLVGVKGTLITVGTSSYYNRAGQLVTVDNPVVRFLGGTTGSFVVGNQLWYLQATDAASAVTTITPAPTEDVWTGSSPPASAASIAHSSGLTPNAGQGAVVCHRYATSMGSVDIKPATLTRSPGLRAVSPIQTARASPSRLAQRLSTRRSARTGSSRGLSTTPSPTSPGIYPGVGLHQRVAGSSRPLATTRAPSRRTTTGRRPSLSGATLIHR